MQVTLDAARQSLTLELGDTAEAQAFFAELKAHGAFMVELADPLAQFTRLTVQVRLRPAFQARFKAEVMQVFPQGENTRCALRAIDLDGHKISQLETRLSGKKDEGLHTGTSPAFRIRQMKPPERFRLAMKASRPERQVLLRDTSAQVLMGLLANPHIEDGEVLEIVKSNYATSGILKRVADNRRWMSRPETLVAVVRNHKTPLPIATKLLPKLPISELRTLAKISGAREALRKAALRVYLQRSGSR